MQNDFFFIDNMSLIIALIAPIDILPVKPEIKIPLKGIWFVFE